MGYNKEAIAACANPKSVAQYIGLEMRPSGSNIFIRCPMHEKNLGKTDSNIGNCVLTKRGFHCFACLAHGDVFDMVMAYTGCSYPEALKTVGDACGGADTFLDGKKPAYKKKIFNLSAEDLALIGLSNMNDSEATDNGRLLCNVSLKKEDETAKTGCIRKGEEYVLYEKVERTSLQTLQDTNLRAFYALIERKAGEAADRYKSALKSCDSNRTVMYQNLLVLLQQGAELVDKDLQGIKIALEKKYKRAIEIQKEYRSLKEKEK